MLLRQRAYIDISHYKTKGDFDKLFKYVQVCADDSNTNHLIQFIGNKLCLVPMEITTELEE